jgi:mevalonate kinase
MIPSKKYPAKVMLFGEYAILSGGKALSVPYSNLATWWSDQHSTIGNKIPHEILRTLEKHCASNPKITGKMDVAAFLSSLNNDEELRTNIPIGYGLGSSGSVVAAVFDRFAYNQEFTTELLLEILGSMEGVFHGKSSGVDPLVSYLNEGVLVDNQEVNTINTKATIPYSFYDTGVSRSTAHLVEIFKERMRDQEFESIIKEKYLPLVDDGITAWLNKDKDASWKTIKKLSAFQLEYFNFAIPASVKPVWEAMLQKEESVLKLCGAGGGGYMLSFTPQ